MTAEGVNVYAWGLAVCSVCVPADMSIEEIEAAVNQEVPTGIDSRWHKSDESFVGGEPNPSPCSQGLPKLHYLFVC